MKNFWVTTGVLVVIGLAVALACYRWHCDEPLHAAARQRDALAWLTTEYHLAPEQAAAIGRLHAAYALHCAEHCVAIGEARAAVAQAERAGRPANELAAARDRVAVREQVCREAIELHLREVAAQMSPEDGARYLGEFLPRVAAYRHEGAPTVRLDE